MLCNLTCLSDSCSPSSLDYDLRSLNAGLLLFSLRFLVLSCFKELWPDDQLVGLVETFSAKGHFSVSCQLIAVVDIVHVVVAVILWQLTHRVPSLADD